MSWTLKIELTETDQSQYSVTTRSYTVSGASDELEMTLAETVGNLLP